MFIFWMEYEKFKHLPLNPNPAIKGSSPQYDLYEPYEIALVKFKDDVFTFPLIIVGIYKNGIGSYFLEHDHRLINFTKRVIGPHARKIEEIEDYQTIGKVPVR
jgi:hypothetical protein